MIVTTVLEQKKVYAAARKLGGYRELVAYAMLCSRKKNVMAYCSEDGCYRTEPCGPFCRDNGNFDKNPVDDKKLQEKK